MQLSDLEPEAITAPISWQEIHEGAGVVLGDLEQLAMKYQRHDVGRLVQVCKILAANPAVAQLVASGVNLFRNQWPWQTS